MSSGVWSGVDTHEAFWEITGPITVVIVAFLSYFVFKEDDHIKRGLAKLNIFNRKDKSKKSGVEAERGTAE